MCIRDSIYSHTHSFLPQNRYILIEFSYTFFELKFLYDNELREMCTFLYLKWRCSSRRLLFAGLCSPKVLLHPGYILWSHTINLILINEFKFVLHFYISLITVVVTFLFNFLLLPAINDQHFLLLVASLKV